MAAAATKMANEDPSMAAPAKRSPCRCSCACVVLIAFILAFAVGDALLAVYGSKKAAYSGAIAAASSTPPGEFTVSLSVRSGSPFSSECFEPGMAVAVVVPGSGGGGGEGTMEVVARGSVGEMACAPRWRPEEPAVAYVAAMGTGGFGGPDAVAAMAAAGKEFDVVLWLPDGGSSKAVVCRGRKIGEPFAPCDKPRRI